MSTALIALFLFDSLRSNKNNEMGQFNLININKVECLMNIEMRILLAIPLFFLVVVFVAKGNNLFFL